MSKEELFKKYQEIVLKTNGGADDYVVALCQISNLNKEFAEEKDQQISDLEAKLAESEKENKTLKDIRTLERVVPRNAQLHKLSNRDCYLKGFENAISETIRTFEETYGKEKCKLIEERDKYLMDIVKAGGYEYQIEELKQQLAESEKSKESYRLQNEQHHLQLLQFYSRLGVEAFGADIHEKALETLMIMKEQLAEKDKENTKLKEVVDCVDKLKQFNADMKDYALVNRDVADEIYCEHQDKISFAVEQLENVKELCREKFNWWENSEWEGDIYDKADVSNAYFDIEANIEEKIKQLKEKE